MAFVVDASFALKWFSADEDDRAGSLALLKSITDTNRPVVPWLWFYEIGNALIIAARRKRISFLEVDEIVRMLEDRYRFLGSNRTVAVDASGSQAPVDGI